MNNDEVKKRRVARIDVAVPKYFGPPALLAGEDEGAYKALRTDVFTYVKPKDIFEKIFTDDIVNLQWQLMRWRRIKVALMNGEQQEEAWLVLLPYIVNEEVKNAFDGWKRQDPDHADAVEQLLESRGVSMEALAAKALSRKLGLIERIDALERTAEGRRSSSMHDLERHREGFAKAFKAAIKDIEDAEFTEIKPPKVKSPPTKTDRIVADTH